MVWVTGVVAGVAGAEVAVEVADGDGAGVGVGVAFAAAAECCAVVERAAALVTCAAPRFDVTAITAAMTATASRRTPASRTNDLTRDLLGAALSTAGADRRSS